MFKISQRARLSNKGNRERDTQSLLDELSELEDDNISHSSVSSVRISSRMSTPCSSRSSGSKESRKRIHPDRTSGGDGTSDGFKLPIFSPDLKQCIRKDTFYTSSQRNRLIKEACMALRGYCWEKDRTVSNIDKRLLAKSLLDLAPNSLGDSGSTSSPEVSSCTCTQFNTVRSYQVFFNFVLDLTGWLIWADRSMVPEPYLYRSKIV